jgi:hypothetical protein
MLSGLLVRPAKRSAASLGPVDADDDLCPTAHLGPFPDETLDPMILDQPLSPLGTKVPGGAIDGADPADRPQGDDRDVGVSSA